MKWEMVKLGEIVSILSGFAFDSSAFSDKTGFPVIRIRDVKRGYTKTFYNSKYDPSFIIVKGDMLIGMDGEFNVGVWKSEPALLNQRVCKIESCNPKRLDNRYLLHFLPFELKKIEDRASFVTVKHLSVKDIREIPIPLPPLATQQRIAEILDKADALRQKDQALLRKYDELAQAVFVDMFGDPVRNEKGWEVKKLSKMGSLDRGVSKHRPRNAPELLGGKYPLIQTGDVANCDGIILGFKNTYSELGLKQSKLWPEGTLCITIAANIAKTGILNFNACFPDSVVGFVPYDVTNTNFIQAWFSFFQKILEEAAPESAQKNINLEILRNLDVICPPTEYQKKFSKAIDDIYIQKRISQNVNHHSESLFQSLLQKAFTGELVS